MLIQQRQIFLHLLGWGRLGELRNQGVSDELYQDLLQENVITHLNCLRWPKQVLLS